MPIVDPFDRHTTNTGIIDPFDAPKSTQLKIKDPFDTTQKPSFLKSAVKAPLAGVGDAIEMYSRALRTTDPEGGWDVIRNVATKGVDLGKSIAEKFPTENEDFGLVKRGVVGGIRSSVPSVAAGVPGAIAGMAGGVPGIVGGYAGSGAIITGAAEYDRFLELADQYGIPKEIARSGAIKSALVEGGIEGAANALDAILLKAGSPVVSGFKQFAKNALKIGGVESGTEAIQAALEAKIARDVGIPAPHPLEAAKEAVIPALTMGGIIGAGGTYANKILSKPVKTQQTGKQAIIDPFDNQVKPPQIQQTEKQEVVLPLGEKPFVPSAQEPKPPEGFTPIEASPVETAQPKGFGKPQDLFAKPTEETKIVYGAIDEEVKLLEPKIPLKRRNELFEQARTEGAALMKKRMGVTDYTTLTKPIYRNLLKAEAEKQSAPIEASPVVSKEPLKPDMIVNMYEGDKAFHENLTPEMRQLIEKYKIDTDRNKENWAEVIDLEKGRPEIIIGTKGLSENDIKTTLLHEVAHVKTYEEGEIHPEFWKEMSILQQQKAPDKQIEIAAAKARELESWQWAIDNASRYGHKIERADLEKYKDSVRQLIPQLNFPVTHTMPSGEVMPGAVHKETSKYSQPKMFEGEKTNIVPKMEAEIQGQQKMFGKPDIFDKLEFNPEQGFRRQPLTPEAQKEIVKKSGIVKLLQQKLDVPIRYGRFRDKALGIFKVRPEVIRTRFANDIETVSHEIGHALQKYLFPESLTKQGLSGKIFQEYQKELISIASKPKAGQAKTPEGFAEFIRLYITNESQAQVKTPKFYNYFDNFLKTNHKEISEIFAEARNRYNRYLTQTPEQRKISQISIGEKQPKTKEPFKEFYTKFLDELYPLRKVVQEMTGGKEIPVIQDPYKLARLMPGIAGKVDSFLEYKPFDYKTYTFYGKSLKEILNQIPKDRLDLYRAYQISKSEYESYQKKGIVADPISIEDSKFIIDKYEAEFGKVFKENVAFRDAVLRYFKDAGMLSRETYKSFKELFENYVPLYRVMDTEGVGGTGKPLEAYQFIKQRRGSWRDFIDPIESDIKNLYAMITLAEKNGVTTALVDLANSKQGMGKYVEKIPAPMQKIMVKTDEVMNQLSADPVFAEMIKEFADLPEAVSIFRKSAFTPKENIISNWRNGKQSLYQVHPDIARTIQALDRESINTVIKILSYPARWLRAGAVLSPEFIGRNPTRDQFSAFIYSKYGFVPGYDLVKGIFHLAKKGEMYWNWKISGAEHAMLVSVDREYLQKTADAVVEDRKIFNIEHVKDVVRNPIEALRALSEIGESGTRIGEFARGIKKEAIGKEGILESGYSAREVILDFGKSGAYSKSINMIIAFWNAHNIGIDKTVRAFKDNPYTTTWKVAASITLPSIILTLVNSQDERWKEIPRWQKDLFWIVMTKNHIWRIPKPFELGILFGTVPERITEYIISQDKNAFKDVYKSILQGLSPNVLPTVAVPIIENWANRSIFLDRPIVPMGKVNLPPQYQYQPYTTGIAKTLGRLISKMPKLGETAIASPAKIENLIRGWTGGLGFHVLKLSDYALRKTGVIDKSVMPSKTMADIPFIKAFAVRYPSADANSIQEFYDRYETNSQKLNAVKQLLKEGRIEEAKQLQGSGVVKDNMTYKALNNMNQTISNIYMNKKMTPEEKRNLIDSIYLQMIKITKYANKQNPQIGR